MLLLLPSSILSIVVVVSTIPNPIRSQTCLYKQHGVVEHEAADEGEALKIDGEEIAEAGHFEVGPIDAKLKDRNRVVQIGGGRQALNVAVKVFIRIDRLVQHGDVDAIEFVQQPLRVARDAVVEGEQDGLVEGAIDLRVDRHVDEHQAGGGDAQHHEAEQRRPQRQREDAIILGERIAQLDNVALDFVDHLLVEVLF